MAIDSGVIKIESTKLQKYNKHIDYKKVQSPETIYDLYEVRLDELSVFLLPDGLLNGTSSYFEFH
jgi:hypothetical protein